LRTSREQRAYYNAFKDYEAYTREEGWHVPRVLAEHVLSLLRGRELLLDVGCGSGWVGMELRGLGWHGTLIGVDIAEQRLRDAAAKKAYTRCLRGNAYKLPFEREVFDAVLSCGMVGLTGPRSVSEMWRVLKPGGVLACAAFESKNEAWSHERLKKSLRQIRCLPNATLLHQKNLGHGYSKSSYAGERYTLYVLRKSEKELASTSCTSKARAQHVGIQLAP